MGLPTIPRAAAWLALPQSAEGRRLRKACDQPSIVLPFCLFLGSRCSLVGWRCRDRSPGIQALRNDLAARHIASSSR